MVGILDCGLGNWKSVLNAFEVLGAEARAIRHPTELCAAERIVLPGVGAFLDGMNRLRVGGWIAALRGEVHERGKPLLGICLGMQLLASVGTEHGEHEGLNWIPGRVERLKPGGGDVRVPHVGWNEVWFPKAQGLYAGVSTPQCFYFVHSYAMHPEDRAVVTGVCDHGQEVVSSVQRGRVFGTQFHPEKSQRAGLKILENFLQV